MGRDCKRLAEVVTKADGVLRRALQFYMPFKTDTSSISSKDHVIRQRSSNVGIATYDNPGTCCSRYD